MTLEATLERIAVALEQLASGKEQEYVLNLEHPDVKKISADLAEPVKKPARGRPAKITTEQKAEATPAEIVEPKPVAVPADDFLDSPPAKPEKPATLDEVRAALQAFAAKNGAGPVGTAKARDLMTKASSNGAVRLSVAKDVPGGDQGVLLSTDYSAVIKAALA